MAQKIDKFFVLLDNMTKNLDIYYTLISDKGRISTFNNQ